MAFLQHIHFPFHYSWCVFSDSALNHEEYSCLSSLERALWNERKCAWAAHKEGLFSSAFGEKQMSGSLRGTMSNSLHLSEDGKGSWWMRHTVDELMEHFQVKIVCVSVILCINSASCSQTVITSSDVFLCSLCQELFLLRFIFVTKSISLQNSCLFFFFYVKAELQHPYRTVLLVIIYW